LTNWKGHNTPLDRITTIFSFLNSFKQHSLS